MDHNYHFKKGSATDRVSEQILQWIASGTYRPGDRLPSEPQISQMVGVSRTPIREAMRLLSSQGLVEIRRGSGTYVTHPPKEQQSPTASPSSSFQNDLDSCQWTGRDLVVYRMALEQAIVELIFKNASHEDLLRLHQKNQQIKDRLDVQGNHEEMLQLDLEFHQLLGECCKNPLLIVTYQHVMGFFRDKLRVLYDLGLSNGHVSYLSHQRIVDALLHNDLTTAREAVADSVHNHLALSPEQCVSKTSDERSPRHGHSESTY